MVIKPLSFPATSDTGFTGIYQLKRLWYHALFGDQEVGINVEEQRANVVLLDILGTGLLPAFAFLHEQRPSFTDFEKWVAAHHGGNIPAVLVQQCNALFANENAALPAQREDVLSASDLQFWDEHGYVIVRNAIPAEDCLAARQAVWDFLEMNENEPASWYKPNEGLQGIMVNLFRHPALDKNRASPRIRRACEQLWGCTDLIVTTDKTGFNPPETNDFTFRGTGLHWDVSLARPIPFGIQGILYLTDTAVNQGAFTLVPGFHRVIDGWLKQLPAGKNPRTQNLEAFNPVPIAAHAGDYIIWNHLLPHGASRNTASFPRIVQYLYWYPANYQAHEPWV